MEEVLLARSWKGLLGDDGTDVLLHENSRAGDALTTVSCWQVWKDTWAGADFVTSDDSLCVQ